MFIIVNSNNVCLNNICNVLQSCIIYKFNEQICLLPSYIKNNNDETDTWACGMLLETAIPNCLHGDVKPGVNFPFSAITNLYSTSLQSEAFFECIYVIHTKMEYTVVKVCSLISPRRIM